MEQWLQRKTWKWTKSTFWFYNSILLTLYPSLPASLKETQTLFKLMASSISQTEYVSVEDLYGFTGSFWLERAPGGVISPTSHSKQGHSEVRWGYSGLKSNPWAGYFMSFRFFYVNLLKMLPLPETEFMETALYESWRNQLACNVPWKIRSLKWNISLSLMGGISLLQILGITVCGWFSFSFLLSLGQRHEVVRYVHN